MFGIKTKRASHEFLEMLLIAIFSSSSQAKDRIHPAYHLNFFLFIIREFSIIYAGLILSGPKGNRVNSPSVVV